MQEAAFEAQARLAAQITSARSAVEQLQALADELDAAAGGLAEETAAHATAAAAKQAKTLKYEEQQRTIAARLEAVGCCPEVSALGCMCLLAGQHTSHGQERQACQARHCQSCPTLFVWHAALSLPTLHVAQLLVMLAGMH